MTITRMLSEMSWSELKYWQERYGSELLGDERDDYRVARVEAAIANYAGKVLKEGATVSPLDCMPFSSDKKPKRKRLNRKRVAESVHAVFGSMVKRQELDKDKQ